MPFQIRTPFSRLGKNLARTLLHDAGGLDGVRYWNRRGFRILMYHNFPASVPDLTEFLAKQCAHIARHYNVVSLTDIARSLRGGAPLPPNALAVTVDDGYRDFLNGHPVFRAHGIPVTVFLVSGFLDRKLWLWWDQLAYLLNNSQRKSFDISFSPEEAPASFNIETDEQRQGALAAAVRSIKGLANEERRELFRKLPQLLHVDLPPQPPDAFAPLGWDDVRKLAGENVDFGAHTVTHPILSRILDPLELSREIEQSKQRIEEELGRPVLHFSYPYGYLKDFNGEAIKVLERCGFQTAVITEKGVNDRNVPPFQMKRFGVEPTTSEWYFKEFLAGLHAGPTASTGT